MLDTNLVVDTARVLSQPYYPTSVSPDLSVGYTILRMTVGMAIVIAVLWIVSVTLKRTKNFGQAGKNVSVIEYRSLGGKRSVALVRALDKIVLLGITDQEVTKLSEWDDADRFKEQIDPQPVESSFEKILFRKRQS